MELKAYRIERLSQAAKKMDDGNITLFGKRLGYVDGAFVRQMLKGTRPITEKTIRKIEEWRGMKGWFDNPSAGSNAMEVEDAPEIVAQQRWLPVVGVVQAGADGLLVIDDHAVGFGDGVVPYWSKCPDAYALRVRGDSMSPRYKPGEFVAVDPCFDVQPGQECIILKTNGERMIKTFLWEREGMACFESINQDHKNITLELSEIDKLHRVLGGVPSFAFKPA